MSIAKVNAAGTEYVALLENEDGIHVVAHFGLSEEEQRAYCIDDYGFKDFYEALEFIDNFEDWEDDDMEIDVFLNSDLN